MSRCKDIQKRFPYGQVHRRRDFGSERVLTLGELVKLDPVPQTETMPAELQRMLESASELRYIESEAEPEIRVTRRSVGRGRRGTIWEVGLDGWDPARSVFAGGGPLVNYARAARHDWS